ncbi:MAG: nitrous oxide reductase accessory protein NosL [Candidatus Kapabacteria bacterium]|nr:nitrous oxide reductase accessory protein NosL [Candidatus Kapabacteria bacterium]
MKLLLLVSISVLSIVATSCSKIESTPIKYGSEQCTSCKMDIVDQKFGAEIVTHKGKSYTFDAPECMIEWSEGSAIKKSDIHSYWVTDFLQPGTLIDAKTACYLESEMIHSPMGLNVSAFRDSNACERARVNYVGKVRTFDAVVDLVNN